MEVQAERGFIFLAERDILVGSFQIIVYRQDSKSKSTKAAQAPVIPDAKSAPHAPLGSAYLYLTPEPGAKVPVMNQILVTRRCPLA